MNSCRTDLKKISEIEQLLHYRFKDHINLCNALTHVSARIDSNDNDHYERLEFLGDRVLGLLIAEKLYASFPDAREGELSLRLNGLVNGETLAIISDKLRLHEYIKTGTDSRELTGHRMIGVRADVLEAIIAAIYLDGGLGAASQFVDRFWEKRLSISDALRRDSKTALQEWAHVQHSFPIYCETARQGPDHEPEFTVTVQVGDLPECVGSGRSKRLAQQNAARAMLMREAVWEEEQPEDPHL